MEELPIFLETSKLIQKKANESIGIRTSQYKYFRDSNDPEKRVHLYDLKIDPFEDGNIAKKFPKIVAEMEEILQNIIKSGTTQSEKEINEDETKRIEEELKKWGYI